MNNSNQKRDAKKKLIGIASDHGGFELKRYLLERLREEGYDILDYGNTEYKPDDDYPDYILPMARALSAGNIGRAIAICGSGVGATIAANKVTGVRACLIHDTFSAHQGVEDDNLNMICFGGLVIGHAFALELLHAFLSAEFSNAERHLRRIEKVKAIEFTK
jgi:ribose 5-phosphate isomerase B